MAYLLDKVSSREWMREEWMNECPHGPTTPWISLILAVPQRVHSLRLGVSPGSSSHCDRGWHQGSCESDWRAAPWLRTLWDRARSSGTLLIPSRHTPSTTLIVLLWSSLFYSQMETQRRIIGSGGRVHEFLCHQRCDSTQSYQMNLRPLVGLFLVPYNSIGAFL